LSDFTQPTQWIQRVAIGATMPGRFRESINAAIRYAMKKVVFAVVLFLSVQFLFAQQNVILIIADDMGTDYCGFYDDGLDTAKMPNLRALLARGVRFKTAWSLPVCSPTRAAILTGRYPFRTGVGTVITGPNNGQLDTSELSIGKLLKYAAPVKYATANIGKWHLHTSTAANRNHPSVMGYDHYSGNFIGQVNDYFNWTKIVDGAAPVTVTNYATTEQVNDAIEWLESLDGTKPFFLWQAFNAPHFPFHLPPDSLHTVPGLTGTAQDIMAKRPEYYKAMMEAMDTELGRLFQWLEAHGMLDNTNIIFIGDNGDDERITQFPNPSRTKSTIYENGVHVPMIIAGPAVNAPNRVSDAIVSTPDLFATILELAGFSDWETHIPADKPVDAVSLMPILKNEGGAVREWIFTEVFDPVSMPDDGKAIRDLEYKLLRFDDGHQEFYRIATDPEELDNLLLQLLLSTEAQNHYLILCNALSNLIGSAACLPSVGVSAISEQGEIFLIPNPATGVLSIGFGEGKPIVSGEVFDSGGRSVLRFNQLVHGSLDIFGLHAGSYLLTMQDASGHRFHARFVKI